MRFVVLGAGGIGSIVAAHLAQAGHDVALIARGAHLEAIRERGLQISGLRRFAVPVEAMPVGAGTCDLLVVATKTHDTVEALGAVRDVRPRAALSLQNGVLKDQLLARELGGDIVLGATTMIGGERIAPGTVEHTLDGMTAIGEPGALVSDRVRQIAEAWNDAGLSMLPVDDIDAHEWAKQILQAAVSPLSVLCNQPTDVIWSTRPLAAALVRLMREAGDVAAALGVTPTSFEGYGFDVQAILAEPSDAAVRRIMDRGAALTAAGKTGTVVSMLQDIRSGRRTEIDETAGHVVAEAERLGVAVPLLALACDVVRGVETALGVRPDAEPAGARPAAHGS